MRIKRKIVLIIYILNFIIALCISIALADTKINLDTHKVCANCHLSEGTDRIMEINELCLKCHPANKSDHPTGVVSKVIPERLPLDSEKRVTCYTCHEPHGKNTVNKLLRMDFNRLCLSCHRDK